MAKMMASLSTKKADSQCDNFIDGLAARIDCLEIRSSYMSLLENQGLLASRRLSSFDELSGQRIMEL